MGMFYSRVVWWEIHVTEILRDAAWILEIAKPESWIGSVDERNENNVDDEVVGSNTR